MGARSAGNFLIYQLIFWIFFVEKKILRVDSIQKTFGRDAFSYCKTAFFCKIAPHFSFIFFKKILTYGRAQRGKFFHISIQFS